MDNKKIPLILSTLLVFAGCGSPEDDHGPGAQSGGSGVGSSTGSGGATQATGGGVGTGGTSAGGASTGGNIGTGSQAGSGGGTSTGGGLAGSGGSNDGTGGDATGGGTASGGDAGTGGDPVPSAGCGKTRTLQDGNHMVTSSGQQRQYHLKTPANYDQDTPYRVIFMFHWNFGSIDAIVNPPDPDHNTDDPYYGMADLAGDSTIFIVPQGLKSNTGGAGWGNANNQDVIFTDDMFEEVSNDLCVDTSRVFTTGFSFGGAISYKLACVRNDLFRAAVVYDTGPVSGNNPSECTNPIAFFSSHGLDDQIFKYSSTGLDVLNQFTELNGCTAMTPPLPADNEHKCVSFEGCTEPVRFCNFGKGQNNTYSPGGHYPSPKDPGQSKSWVPDEAWDFISQF